MQSVRSTGSKIETKLAKSLFSLKLRYRKNDRTVYGKPDLTFKKHKIAIFVDSEFWHGKDWEIRKGDIKSNREFWLSKIERNIQRDKEVNDELFNTGWKVIRFSGKDINKNLRTCTDIILQEIMNPKEKISIDELDGKRFQIRLTEPVPSNHKKAVITHYLHNLNNGIAKHYKTDALEYNKEYVQFQEEENNLALVAEDAIQQLLFEVENVPYPTPSNYKFSFIDLFAGIGGFRLAMQNLGGKCVFTSEWDKEAQRTYRTNFGEVPFGDITKEETKKFIPDDFDLLCAGFPCQSFSIAGKRGGFDDTRGTLFFDVAEIIKRKKPKAIFLENVKGLRNHNGEKTLESILMVA